MQIEMELVKVTKNTYRFDAIMDGKSVEPAVSAVYVGKAAFRGSAPKTITLTLEGEGLEDS